MEKKERKGTTRIILFLIALLLIFLIPYFSEATQYPCNSRSDCNDKIREAEGGDEVILTQDIEVNYWIYIDTKTNFIFNCNGSLIDSTVAPDPAIWIRAGNTVKLRNCILDGKHVGSKGIFISNGAENVFIENSEIRGFTYRGIDHGGNGGTGKLVVTNSYIHDNDDAGILIHNNQAHAEIYGTMIINNKIGVYYDSGVSGKIINSTLAKNTQNDLKARITLDCQSTYCEMDQQCSFCAKRRADPLPDLWAGCIQKDKSYVGCQRYSWDRGFNFKIPTINFCAAMPDACYQKPEYSKFCKSEDIHSVFDCAGCGGNNQVDFCGSGICFGTSGYAYCKNCKIDHIGVSPVLPECWISENQEYVCNENSKINISLKTGYQNECNSIKCIKVYLSSPKTKRLVISKRICFNTVGQSTDINTSFFVNSSYFSSPEVRRLFDPKYNPWNITQIYIYNTTDNYVQFIGRSTSLGFNSLPINFSEAQAPPGPECEIKSAFVDTKFCTGMPQPDGTKKCFEGDKINISITINDLCYRSILKEIKVDLSEESGEEWGLPITGYAIFEGCSMTLGAPDSGALRCGVYGTDKICWGYATLSDVSPECFNKPLNASYVAVYNQSGFVQDNVGFFGNITIIKPACNIVSAQIIPNCNGVCDIGEEITLNIAVEDKDKCKNVSKMEILGGNGAGWIGTAFVILGLATGGGSECSITMENSGSIRAYNQNLPGISNGFYTSTWTIKEIKPECNGQKITASTAKLYNASGIIGSLSGTGVEGSFTFTYRDLNKPMQAIINTTPNLEGILNPLLDIKLEQLSIGDIKQWNWSYKSVESQKWTLYKKDGQMNTTIKFSEPPRNIKIGNYEINLSVWNETMWDSTKVKIRLLSPGHGPLAVISVPSDNQVFTSRTVPFDGDLSEWPEYVDLFNMTWIFSDTKNKTVNASVSKTMTYRYDKSLASPNSFKIKLNASGGNKYTIDIVNFYIGVCDEGSSKNPRYIFAGECGSDKPNWCDPSTCDSITKTCEFTPSCTLCGCIGGKTCNMAQGTCVAAQTMQTCGDKSSGTCENDNPPGCYLDKEENPDKCKSCYSYGQRTITSCSNYSNPESCGNDKCQLGISGSDALLMLGQRKLILGEEYEVIKTQCSWNLGTTSCTLNATWSPAQSNNNPVPQNVQCIYSTLIGSCGSCNAGIFQGKLIKYTLVSGTQENCGGSYESCARCGFTQERLPFFSVWQIIPVIFLIVMYYFVVSKKKRMK